MATSPLGCNERRDAGLGVAGLVASQTVTDHLGGACPAAAAPGAPLPAGLREDVFRAIGDFSDEYADVLARYREGLTQPAQIAAAGAAKGDPAAVDRALLRIRYMLGDPVTTGPGRARKVAGTVRSVSSQPGTSPAVREWLATVVERLEMLAATSDGAGVRGGPGRPTRSRGGSAHDVDEAMEYARSRSCVYVYTFPTYWKHPDDGGRRMLKVGMTTRDAENRILGQARLTASPEDPAILRVYPTEDPIGIEQRFHLLLRSAGHVGPATRLGGTEWFPTTLEYLDAIAVTMGLEIVRGRLPG